MLRKPLFIASMRRCGSAVAAPLCRHSAFATASLVVSTRRFSLRPTCVARSAVFESQGSTPVSNPAVEAAMGTRPPPACTLTPEQFAKLAPMNLLLSALEQHTRLAGTEYAAAQSPAENHVVVSRDTFNEFCALSHVVDADAALAALHAAALVVSIDGGRRVHLRPVQYLEELEVIEALQAAAPSTAAGLADLPLPGPFLLAEVERRVAALEDEEAATRGRLQPAIARAARWRRCVWGGALLYAGTQLAVIARLTYFDLDWDTMEPISYCLGIGTTLLFYLYYLRYDSEHTYYDFDKRHLPGRVRKYAPTDFDWPAYDGLCQRLTDERLVRERLRAWANKH